MQEDKQQPRKKKPITETEKPYINTNNKKNQSGNLLFDQEQMLLLDSLWRSLKHYAVQTVLLVVAGAILLGASCFLFITPMYRSQATLVVGSSRSVGGSTTDVASQSFAYNESVAKELVATFPYIMENEAMTELIKIDLGVEDINGTISASSIADTGMFTLTVSSDSASDAYDILTSAIKNFPTVASLSLSSYEVSLIEEPDLAVTSYNKNSWLIGMAIGALLGFMVAFCFVWVRANRKSIRSNDDFIDYLNIESLGMIPQIQLKNTSKGRSSRQKGKSDNSNSGDLILLTNRHLGSGFVESIRALRIGILRRLEMINRDVAKRINNNHADNTADDGIDNMDHPIASLKKVIIFTSTVPGEGKSTIAANVALSLAQNGFRTVLIDGDLRVQNIKNTMGLQNKPSLSLAEVLDSAKTLVRFNLLDYLLPTQEEKLWLLAGDNTIEDPQPLLADPVVGKILLRMRDVFDYIIIDTPPCALMADTMQLAEYADCAVYIIRQEIAERNQIRDSIEALADTGITVLGCVLNGAEAGISSNYGSNYYGYKYGGYGYGGNYGYGSKK